MSAMTPQDQAAEAEFHASTPANMDQSGDEELDHDDMEYELTTEGDDDDFEDEDDALDEYNQDAEEELRDIQVEFAIGEEGEEVDDDEDTETEDNLNGGDGAGDARPFLTRQALLQLLGGQRGFRQLFVQHLGGGGELDDSDDDDGALGRGVGGRRRRQTRSNRAPIVYPKVPSDTGTELMSSGKFGRTDPRLRPCERRKPDSVAYRLLRRELGTEFAQAKIADRLVAQDMLPASKADTIVEYDSRVYSGQFSDDGNFFFSCGQDFRVRMYDTSNPYRWKYYKSVVYHGGRWTITDASLSPDNKFLAYSSIRPRVCLASTDPHDDSEPWLLDFSRQRRRGAHDNYYDQDFGIWSIRFSGDGREIVAGTGDHCVYVYDIETRQTILRINGHEEDVNAVCFGDNSSPHILYSGSDDATLKVWDRRSMGDSREAGAFLGHTEGITYIDSKGDGRYVLSNAKDQTMKLWDLRRMISAEKFDSIDRSNFSGNTYDYRFQDFEDRNYRVHPHDCSLVSYRGHRVTKTLIRCHFSPPGSTNSRFVYTGSADGSVYIYNLDATLAGKIDVKATTKNTSSRDSAPHGADAFRGGGISKWETCVRDVSWHPSAPVIAAVAWNGWSAATGSVTIHNWNDGADDDEAEPRMGTKVDARLQRESDELGDIDPSHGEGGQPAPRRPRRQFA